MNDAAIRLGIFFGILCIMLLWEQVAAFRDDPKRWQRRGINLSFSVINSFLVRLFWPAGLASVALWAESKNIGLFHWLNVPFAINLIVGVILMDALIYFQHRVFHLVPVLWRMHRMHHSDTAFDVTTALRFHPFEILLSMLIKLAAVLILGLDATTILVFEVILNGLAMFNHGNVRLPKNIEQPLRWLIVTPDMHRVHHSVDLAESNRNFGFNLSIWDRLFASYQAQPAKGHSAMTIGLDHYPTPKAGNLLSLLNIPFYSIKPADRQETLND